MDLVISEVTEEYLNTWRNLQYVWAASIVVYFLDIVNNFDTEVSCI